MALLLEDNPARRQGIPWEENALYKNKFLKKKKETEEHSEEDANVPKPKKMKTQKEAN